MRVYIVRHGRTALNAAGSLRGRIDAPLDDVGRLEASRLGTLFASVPLAEVVSSPLRRALDTAAAIARPHDLAVAVDPGFIDRDYGPWAGGPEAAVEARYGRVDSAPASEIEPRAALTRRARLALETAVERAKPGPLVVVAHDAVNRALIHALCAAGLPSDAVIPQPTGCWNRLLWDEQGIVCEVIGAPPDDGTGP